MYRFSARFLIAIALVFFFFGFFSTNRAIAALPADCDAGLVDIGSCSTLVPPVNQFPGKDGQFACDFYAAWIYKEYGIRLTATCQNWCGYGTTPYDNYVCPLTNGFYQPRDVHSLCPRNKPPQPDGYCVHGDQDPYVNAVYCCKYTETTPNCDRTPVCSNIGTCNAPANTCAPNNGTKTDTGCVYTTYSGGGACIQVTSPNQTSSCTTDNCSAGYTCINGACVVPPDCTTDPECEDNNNCTYNRCISGKCSFPNEPNSTSANPNVCEYDVNINPVKWCCSGYCGTNPTCGGPAPTPTPTPPPSTCGGTCGTSTCAPSSKCVNEVCTYDYNCVDYVCGNRCYADPYDTTGTQCASTHFCNYDDSGNGVCTYNQVGCDTTGGIKYLVTIFGKILIADILGNSTGNCYVGDIYLKATASDNYSVRSGKITQTASNCSAQQIFWFMHGNYAGDWTVSVINPLPIGYKLIAETSDPNKIDSYSTITVP